MIMVLGNKIWGDSSFVKLSDDTSTGKFHKNTIEDGCINTFIGISIYFRY
jgi:hypothetical protein